MAKSIPIERYFLLTTWLTAIFAIALATFSDVFSIQALVGLPVLVLVALISRRHKNRKMSSILVPVVAWIQIIYAVFEMFLSQDVVYLGDGIAILLVLNLLNVKSRGRYWVVMVSSLLLCFSGLVLEPGVVGYLLFIAYLIIASASLNGANLFLSIQNIRDTQFELGARYFLQIVKSTPMGLLLAVSVFILFPRINKLAVELPFQVKQRFKTGYNGAIDLNGQGNIAESDTVVMHVGTSDIDWLQKHALDLYLRGSALDTFIGNQWVKTMESSEPYTVYQPLFTNSKKDISHGRDLEITMTPLRSRVIFLPNGSFLLKDISKSVERMFLDIVDGGLTRSTDAPDRYGYTVQTYPKIESEAMTLKNLLTQISELKQTDRLRPFNLGLASLTRLTDVPLDIRNAQYFTNWMQNFKFTKKSSLRSILIEIRNYFRSNYQATLINTFSGKSSFESFLTDDKFGHCEFFSTASVLLLRSYGIPSRIVTGYRGGEYNPIADAVIVKELHAHAWVEYFIPESGWHLFDPTPSVMAHYNQETLSNIVQYMNAANYYLNRYLVDYNIGTQKDLVNQFKQTLTSEKLSREFSFNYIIYIVIVFLVLYLAFRMFRYRWKSSRNELPEFYLRFLALVAAIAPELEKNSYETYSDFLNRVQRETGFDPNLVTELKNILLSSLYGREIEDSEAQGQSVLDHLELSQKK